MRKILFYTRKHCGICLDSLSTLQQSTSGLPGIVIDIKDIDARDNYDKKILYHTCVPVVEIGNVAYKYPFDFSSIIKSLNDSRF
jgi:hypothetical protein